jgi:hypothetical protein
VHCQNAGDRTYIQLLEFYLTLSRRRKAKSYTAAELQEFSFGTSAMRERYTQLEQKP